jgi:hypothetical protein
VTNGLRDDLQHLPTPRVLTSPPTCASCSSNCGAACRGFKPFNTATLSNPNSTCFNRPKRWAHTVRAGFGALTGSGAGALMQLRYLCSERRGCGTHVQPGCVGRPARRDRYLTVVRRFMFDRAAVLLRGTVRRWLSLQGTPSPSASCPHPRRKSKLFACVCSARLVSGLRRRGGRRLARRRSW